MNETTDEEEAYNYIMWERFDKAREEFPNYSLKEMIYSLLKNSGIKSGEVLKKTYKEFYTAINKMIKDERN